MILSWAEKAWEDYLYWQKVDKKTLKRVNALIKADRDFEMIVFPGGGHGIGESPYGQRRRKDFFVRHLLGQEPRWSGEATGGKGKPGRGRKPRSG